MECQERSLWSMRSKEMSLRSTMSMANSAKKVIPITADLLCILKFCSPGVLLYAGTLDLSLLRAMDVYLQILTDSLISLSLMKQF
ncbi:hypothetical protein Y1Q_0021772 [Alligator mississippiensis]|uniref:Uncharacterized protein n=1 Tax=Alligator mississippiensis TaxID=8496 RepID=A0A151PBU7_ALLMI|nr:hypothetical protein Y1Q_0021772 [Alligator mississippiensis]